MPRKRTPVSNYFPYHIIARANNREWFALPMNQIWEIFSDYLFLINKVYSAKIYAFTLMDNHFHLIVSTPQHPLGEIMNRFMTETSQAINALGGRINHVYGGRHKACLIENAQYFANVTKYVYRNPVHAGLCIKVEEYPWSSLSGTLGRGKIIFPLDRHAFNSVLPKSVEENLAWLNSDLKPIHRKLITRALTKTQFYVPSKKMSDEAYEIRSGLC